MKAIKNVSALVSQLNHFIIMYKDNHSFNPCHVYSVRKMQTLNIKWPLTLSVDQSISTAPCTTSIQVNLNYTLGENSPTLN